MAIHHSYDRMLQSTADAGLFQATASRRISNYPMNTRSLHSLIARWVLFSADPHQPYPGRLLYRYRGRPEKFTNLCKRLRSGRLLTTTRA